MTTLSKYDIINVIKNKGVNMRIFRSGRNNLAVTIYTPKVCDNKCEFCVNNLVYDRYEANSVSVLNTCRVVADTDIKEIVISGGEPMKDLVSLALMLEIFKNKDVYINTSLINENFSEFAELVNNFNCVKCLNISRHYETYESDKKLLNNIVEDNKFLDIKVPIRINVLLQEGVSVGSIIYRWKDYTVNLRADFKNTTKGDLHTLKGIPNKLLDMELVNHTFCEVCDTKQFRNSNGQTVLFHKGLITTSYPFNKHNSKDYIVNDIIIYPDGSLHYDWSDDCSMTKEELFHNFSSVKYRVNLPPYSQRFDKRSLRDKYYNCECAERIVSCGGRAYPGWICGNSPNSYSSYNSCGKGSC